MGDELSRAENMDAEIGFHYGRIIIQLSNTYPTLHKAILEAVQNAIDAGASIVFVGIDRKSYEVIIMDDGSGISPEKFRKAIGTLGATLKGGANREPGTLGRFGLGVISPLAKCGTMHIISQPEGEQTVAWKLRVADIEQQASSLNIPGKPLGSFPAVPRAFSAAKKLSPTWRTMIRLQDVVDRQVSKVALGKLRYDITQTLGGGMRFRNTSVVIMVRGNGNGHETIRIDPPRFTGKPLESFVVEEVDAGTVQFNLYYSHAPEKNAEAGVSFNDSPDSGDAISFGMFRNQTITMDESPDPELLAALELLGNGSFQGLISGSNVQMEANRTHFVVDAALEGFHSAIISWYREIGQNLVETERIVQDDERYNRLTHSALESLLEDFQRSPDMVAIYEMLGDVMPEPESKSRKARGRNAAGSTSKPRTSRREPLVIKPKLSGGPVISGKRPRFPTIILRFFDDARMWYFDRDKFEIHVNLDHPDWIRMDETNGRHTHKNDEHIKRFQKWLVYMIMMLLLDSQGDENAYERGIGEINKYMEGMTLVLG